MRNPQIDAIAERLARTHNAHVSRTFGWTPNFDARPADWRAMRAEAMRETLLSLTDDDLRELRFRDQMPPAQEPAQSSQPVAGRAA